MRSHGRLHTQAFLHTVRIAQHELRVETCVRDTGMQREQTHRASRRAAGCASNELVHSCGEGERAFLYVLAQRIPRGKAVLARDHRLRIVQREIACGNGVERLVRQ